MSQLSNLVLWLFVINLGIAFGAGLYESRILAPQWLTGSPESGYRWNAEAARQANTGLNFWVYVTTVPRRTWGPAKREPHCKGEV